MELDPSAGKVMWAEKSAERAKSLPAYLVRKVVAFDPLRGNGNVGYSQKCKKTATFLRSKWSPDLRRVLHDDGYYMTLKIYVCSCKSETRSSNTMLLRSSPIYVKFASKFMFTKKWVLEIACASSLYSLWWRHGTSSVYRNF